MAEENKFDGGGPAYPATPGFWNDHPDGYREWIPSVPGATIWDQYFMAAVAGAPVADDTVADQVARWGGLVADAGLEERKKRFG